MTAAKLMDDHILSIEALGGAAFFLFYAAMAILFATRGSDKGEQLFWQNFAFVFCLAALGSLSFTFAAIILPNKINELNFWFVNLIYLAFGMFSLVIGLVIGIVPETIHLHEIELPLGDEGDLTIAHLSDLHICSTSTIEGSIESGGVSRAADEAITWASSRAKLVIVTGDITDSGQLGEWNSFQQLLSSRPAEERERILFIPGNHDFGVDVLSSPFS